MTPQEAYETFIKMTSPMLFLKWDDLPLCAREAWQHIHATIYNQGFAAGQILQKKGRKK